MTACKFARLGNVEHVDSVLKETQQNCITMNKTHNDHQVDYNFQIEIIITSSIHAKRMPGHLH